MQTMESLFRAPGTRSAARLSGCKNFAAAQPGEQSVFLPQWGVTLSCRRPVPPRTAAVGLRSHHLHLAAPGEENAFSCQVVRVIDDVFASILLLRPEGAEPDAPLLRMELDKAVWAAHDGETAVMAAIRPEDVLLLEDL